MLDNILEKLNVTYETDNAHGWLIVREIDIRNLSLDADSFSEFSYYSVQGGVTYFALEEDCDASVFSTAARKQGYALDVRETNTNGYSFVRGWSSLFQLISKKRFG